MKKIVVAFSLLLVAMAALPAFGQSCTQGGTTICGPTCGNDYDILYDPTFSQTSCNAWQFGSGTQRATSGTYCGYWPAPFGQFNGPNANWEQISQTTTALSGGDGWFSFRYEYEITDPGNSAMLDVWLVDGNGTWYHIDQPPGGAQYCVTRLISLGYHTSWKGQNLTVYLFGYVPNSNSKIVVDNVKLFQHQF